MQLVLVSNNCNLLRVLLCRLYQSWHFLFVRYAHVAISWKCFKNRLYKRALLIFRLKLNKREHLGIPWHVQTFAQGIVCFAQNTVLRVRSSSPGHLDPHYCSVQEYVKGVLLQTRESIKSDLVLCELHLHFHQHYTVHNPILLIHKVGTDDFDYACNTFYRWTCNNDFRKGWIGYHRSRWVGEE